MYNSKVIGNIDQLKVRPVYA